MVEAAGSDQELGIVHGGCRFDQIQHVVKRLRRVGIATHLLDIGFDQVNHLRAEVNDQGDLTVFEVDGVLGVSVDEALQLVLEGEWNRFKIR